MCVSGNRVRYPPDYTPCLDIGFRLALVFGFFLPHATFTTGPIKTVPANLFGGDAHTCELLTYRNNYEKTTTKKIFARFWRKSRREVRSARIRSAAATHIYRAISAVGFTTDGVRMQRRFVGKKHFSMFSENGGFDGRTSEPRFSWPL